MWRPKDLDTKVIAEKTMKPFNIIDFGFDGQSLSKNYVKS